MAKIFEVGDVLPAGLIEIYGEVEEEESVVITFNNNYIQLDYIGSPSFITNFPYTYKSHNFMIIDLSLVSPSDRVVIAVQDYWGFIEWEEVISGFSITFNSNGGTTISDIEEATELPTPLPTPTKSGYAFVAWYYESNFQTRAKAGDTIESNTTLYAKWHNLGSLFTEIADAIRSKDGTSENIRDVDFGERVKQIQPVVELTQEEYDELESYDNNTYYLIVEE